MMRVISVNVGTLRTIPRRGQQVPTGIFKDPINGRVAVRSNGLDGDQQGDLLLHGGIDKAVYVYPKEHYAYWQSKFPDLPLPWGMFGENLTTEGALEDATYLGDRWHIGSAQFEIVQPREPCYKLGVKFGNPKIVKQFLASGRSGWYLKVIKEGTVEAGDKITRSGRNTHDVTVTDLNGFLSHSMEDRATLQRALRIESLPGGWRDSITQFLSSPQYPHQVKRGQEPSPSTQRRTTDV